MEAWTIWEKISWIMDTSLEYRKIRCIIILLFIIGHFLESKILHGVNAYECGPDWYKTRKKKDIISKGIFYATGSPKNIPKWYILLKRNEMVK